MAAERPVPVAGGGGLSLLIAQRRESGWGEFVNGGAAEGYGAWRAESESKKSL